MHPDTEFFEYESGESNIRAQISGDVQAGIRLRPVDSVHLARRKATTRCAVKLSKRKLINIVANILQKLL